MNDSSQPGAGIDGAWRVTILTLVTMVAFAANSILCRQALDTTPIDPATTLCADGYAVVGLRAGYRPAQGLAWFVDARNLTDETYAASTGVIADARGRDSAQFLPGDGIAVYGGIEWRFETRRVASPACGGASPGIAAWAWWPAGPSCCGA